jgi:hypothetical protein
MDPRIHANMPPQDGPHGVLRERTDRPRGIRDRPFRDPARTLIRDQDLR